MCPDTDTTKLTIIFLSTYIITQLLAYCNNLAFFSGKKTPSSIWTSHQKKILYRENWRSYIMWGFKLLCKEQPSGSTANSATKLIIINLSTKHCCSQVEFFLIFLDYWSCTFIKNTQYLLQRLYQQHFSSTVVTTYIKKYIN